MVLSRKNMVEVTVQKSPCTAMGTLPVSHIRGNHRPQGWSLHAVAGAVALATTLLTSNAWALALGRITVQSRLGEPLRAEIDVPSISADEAATLQVGMASMEAFKAASMEYNPLLQEVTMTLQRRPDGRSVLRVSSQRVVTEPFLDMVVEASWASGKLVRGYTLLLDPPNLRQPPSPQMPATAPLAPTAAQPAETARPPTASPTPTSVVPTRATAAPANNVKIPVKRGDTAGRIAAAHKPAGVSLDQMLIGMLRANPGAFVGRNVNRLKAGTVLDLPDEATVASIPDTEARRQVAVQSRDFNEYRRRLAAAAPAQTGESLGRQASGTVQPADIKTEESKPVTPDKLTLSKGAVAAKSGQEDQIAEQRRQDENTQRTTELKRNLEELKQLNATTSSTAAAPEPTQPPKTGTEPPTAPGIITPAAMAPATEAPTPSPAPEPSKTTTPPPPPPAPTAAPAAGGFLSDLLTNPLALPVGGGVAAALLGALAWLRLRQRKETATAASVEDDSRFEAAGGQTVDTSEDDVAVSSMMYSPSQLDAAGDVDPVAEADVYLAYGRDKQAEEILLEALRLHPERMPVRLKLLEIHAQRNDRVAFQNAATELHTLTSGTGPDWEQARDMGYALDPDNALYQPTGAAHWEAPAAEEIAPAPSTDMDLGFAAPEPTVAEPVAIPEPAEPQDDGKTIDFDLDISTPEPRPEMAVAEAGDEPVAHNPLADLDFDLDISSPEVADATAPEPSSEPHFELDTAPAADVPTPLVTEDHSLDFDLDLSDMASETATPAEPVAVADAPSPLPPDVQGLSLDFDLAQPAPAEPEPMEPDFDALSNLEVNEEGVGANPLETKLSLAREFEAIGDSEGARSLAEEVAAEATGELQARARAFLSQLS